VEAAWQLANPDHAPSGRLQRQWRPANGEGCTMIEHTDDRASTAHERCSRAAAVGAWSAFGHNLP